jgi:hypothetical protein
MAPGKRWVRLGLVLLSLPSLGCELGSFLRTELSKPAFEVVLDHDEYAQGQPIQARVTLVPEPGVRYRVAIVSPEGQLAAQAPIRGTETVVLTAPAPGSYDAQLQADGRMLAHYGITVR